MILVDFSWKTSFQEQSSTKVLSHFPGKASPDFPSGQATFHSHLPGGQETSKSSACVWVILVEGDFVGLFFWS